MAKCYFAKHKLVWEVLEGGLKSKIEFHWSDITAIKATFSEGVNGTLDIVVGFFFPPQFVLVVCWSFPLGNKLAIFYS